MRRVLPLVGLLLAAAGCKKTLHWKVLEDQFVATAEEHNHGEHFTATCPETEVKIGLSFRCTLHDDRGQSEQIEVTLTNLAGGYLMKEIADP